MKKVLYVNTTSVQGGAEKSVLLLMDKIRERGVEPILLVPSHGWLVDRCIEKGITVEFLPTLPDAFATNTFKQQALSWIPNAVAIASLVRQHGISLIHANSPRASYHAGLGARLARVPCIVHVHDADPDFLPYSSYIKKLILLPISDEFVTVSEFTKHSLQKFLPPRSRITTIYNGIEVKEIQSYQSFKEELGLPSDSFLIGSISAMTPWKGQDIIIQAFHQIHKKLDNLYLVIVGGVQGSESQRLHFQNLLRLTKELGLESRVYFTGWRRDIVRILLDIDIFVHVPVRPDPLPSVVLEACAAGRPIIASNIGGIPEIIENNVSGILVEPANISQLADKIEWAVSNRLTLAEMGRRAKRLAQEKFTVDQMASNFYAFYQRHINHKL